MTMKQPNILLIMTDQLRGDCLGAAGHPDVKTPYLDSLAARGTLFDRAYSSCPSCIPARAALHTGLSQEKHGRVGYQDCVDFRYPHTMAGELAKAGYYTQCVGKMHVHPLRNLMGFHHVELHDGYLHAYRRPDTPWYESQKVADDYFYWLKNGHRHGMQFLGLPPLYLRRNVPPHQLGQHACHRFSAPPRPEQTVFPHGLLSAPASALRRPAALF